MLINVNTMTEIMDCIVENYFLCSFEYVLISSPTNEYTPSVLTFSATEYIKLLMGISWFTLGLSSVTLVTISYL